MTVLSQHSVMECHNFSNEERLHSFIILIYDINLIYLYFWQQAFSVFLFLSFSPCLHTKHFFHLEHNIWWCKISFGRWFTLSQCLLFSWTPCSAICMRQNYFKWKWKATHILYLDIYRNVNVCFTLLLWLGVDAHEVQGCVIWNMTLSCQNESAPL